MEFAASNPCAKKLWPRASPAFLEGLMIDMMATCTCKEMTQALR